MRACRLCGAEAVEQTRGLLTPVDRDYVPPFVGGSATSNAPVNSADTRVACTKCDNATGWNKGEMADYTRFCWDRDNAQG